MKVDGSLHSLIQGVSQQPAKVMLAGQCRLQENMSSNPVESLTRRPPTNHAAQLSTLSADTQFYDFSVLGVDYILAASIGQAKVFRLDGFEVPTTLGSGAAAYLNGNRLCFTTLEDIVYVGNTGTKVLMLPDTKDYAPSSSIVHLNGGQYGRDYIVKVKWGASTATFHYQTPNGSVSTDTPKVASTYIATQLETNFNATGSLTAVFSISRQDDVLLITSTNAASADFNITVDDGAGGTVMFATNNTVVDVGNLPRYAPEGYFVSVTGGSSDTDDYYLVFHTNSGASAIGTDFGLEGVYRESVLEDIPYLLDTSTMPLILTYNEGTATFTLAKGDWKGRQVGDTLTNEDPSFVGNTINFMRSFQGRLLFLSGDNAILSRTDKPLDFWRQSVTVLADSDPIDEASTAQNVGKLLTATPFDRDMVIFAEKGQFILFGRNALTPQNASLVLTTTFEADLNAIPVAAGKNIFFGMKYGKFTGVREFFTDGSADINDTRLITRHVTKYLKGNVLQLTSSTNFDVLFVKTDDNDKVLYTYEYTWQDQKKVQSSWSTWIFPNSVAYTFMTKSNLYIIYKIGTDFVLDYMNPDTQLDETLPYQVKLDRKVTTPLVNTNMLNPLTHMPDDFTTMLFVQGDGCPHPGMLAVVESHDSSSITFEEDMLGGDIISGIKYASRYKPNMPFVKDRDGVTVGTGKLVVNKFIANFRDTGFIGSIVSSLFAPATQMLFTGRQIGDPHTVVGEPVVISGSHVIPFREDTRIGELELFSSSHLPMTIVDLEWKGQYTKKGQRITSGG